ncbi:MAG: thiamine biosynthesis protein ThiS [Deltaproteobacteria bacterium]|nr:thiamine biosynthesis protein ThiS [Deltaproteobacteria bacterium]
MTISFNGTDMDFPSPISLAQLLADLGLFDQPGVAVAQNQQLIRRADWISTIVHDGDELEVLHATAGG